MKYNEFPRLAQDIIEKMSPGEQCAHTYRVAKPHIESFRCAVDIGSKFGNFSVQLQKEFQKVESFDMRNKMRWRVLDRDKVKFHQTALGDHTGSIEYYGASTRINLHNKEKMTSPITTIDSFNFMEIDFMKLDVEGDELSVLKGAKQTIDRCSPVIVLEQNHVVEDSNKGTKYQAVEYLLTQNYCVVDFDGISDWIMKRK